MLYRNATSGTSQTEVPLPCREKPNTKEASRVDISRYAGIAGIVVCEPGLKVCRCAHIFLIRRGLAADDVDVPHGTSPSSLRHAGHASPCGLHVAAPRVARRAKRGGPGRIRTDDNT